MKCAVERKVLPPFTRKCRWFGGKAKVVSKVSIHKAIPLKVDGDMHFLTILEVHYVQRLLSFISSLSHFFHQIVFLKELSTPCKAWCARRNSRQGRLHHG
jgi:hypothetical protein